MSFNASQTRAIHHKNGPMLVLAGPGSGKTLVITERTKYLIEVCGIDPAQILVITFTKAAATEAQVSAENEPVMSGDIWHVSCSIFCCFKTCI